MRSFSAQHQHLHQHRRLQNEQWMLLRTQIGSLMGGLAEIQMEMSSLKENAMTKDVEQVINNLLGSHEDHGEKHAGLLERVAYLEQFVGESADHHAKAVEEAGSSFEDHKTTMETRLEYLEALLGDTADKHAKELKAAQASTHAAHGRLQELHDAIQQCAQAEHHASVEERVNFLEKSIGESVDKHDTHKVNFEIRLEFIEGLLGDNAEKHAAEIETLRTNMDARHGNLQNAHSSLQDAISLCAKHDHASGLESRMEYIEKVLGESADKHAKHSEHSTTMETRLEYMEGLLGDNADKHVKEIESLRSKHGSLEDAIKLCAKHEHASSLGSRMEYLEKLLGDSADEHEKHMKELGAHASKVAGLKGDQVLRDQKHASLEDRFGGLNQRLMSVENLNLQHNFDRLLKEHEEHKHKVRDAEAKVEQQRHSVDSHKITTEQRLERTEASLQEQLLLERSLRDDSSRHMKEHWERELKARQAYHEQYKDLLQEERFSRESLRHDSEQRVITLERCLSLETNRLWVAIDKHSHDPKGTSTSHNIVVRQQSYAPRSPSTIVDVVDTQGHHHLEASPARVISSPVPVLSMSSGMSPRQSSGYPGGTQSYQMQQHVPRSPSWEISDGQVAPLLPMSPSLVTPSPRRATPPPAGSPPQLR